MSQTHDKRRRTDLDLFVLAMIENEISTPYDLQRRPLYLREQQYRRFNGCSTLAL